MALFHVVPAGLAGGQHAAVAAAVDASHAAGFHHRARAARRPPVAFAAGLAGDLVPGHQLFRVLCGRQLAAGHLARRRLFRRARRLAAWAAATDVRGPRLVPGAGGASAERPARRGVLRGRLVLGGVRGPDRRAGLGNGVDRAAGAGHGRRHHFGFGLRGPACAPRAAGGGLVGHGAVRWLSVRRQRPRLDGRAA
ncbi:hypothetical protein D3C87_1602180 [compost metagenome]